MTVLRRSVTDVNIVSDCRKHRYYSQNQIDWWAA